MQSLQSANDSLCKLLNMEGFEWHCVIIKLSSI